MGRGIVGGIVGGIGGGIFGTMWYLVDIVKNKIRAKLYCQVTIKHNDDTFKWVNKYMKDRGLIKDDGHLRCRIKVDDAPWWEAIFQAKKGKPDLEFVPGAGYHIFTHKGKKFWVHHWVGATMTTGHDYQPTEMEELTIVTWGTDTQHIKDFIDDCVVHNMKVDHDKIGIYEQH